MKYFYSYLLRRRSTGSEVGYGDGVTKQILVLSCADLDDIRFAIIEHIFKEISPDFSADEVSVHLIALTPLPSES